MKVINLVFRLLGLLLIITVFLIAPGSSYGSISIESYSHDFVVEAYSKDTFQFNVKDPFERIKINYTIYSDPLTGGWKFDLALYTEAEYQKYINGTGGTVLWWSNDVEHKLSSVTSISNKAGEAGTYVFVVNNDFGGATVEISVTLTFGSEDEISPFPITSVSVIVIMILLVIGKRRQSNV